jgi:hypothetical protein
MWDSSQGCIGTLHPEVGFGLREIERMEIESEEENCNLS